MELQRRRRIRESWLQLKVVDMSVRTCHLPDRKLSLNRGEKTATLEVWGVR